MSAMSLSMRAETFGRVVPFDCHSGPCLSWEKKSIATSTITPLFRFAQSEEQAVVAAVGAGRNQPIPVTERRRAGPRAGRSGVGQMVHA
jgi:hypothetical protein